MSSRQTASLPVAFLSRTDEDLEAIFNRLEDKGERLRRGVPNAHRCLPDSLSSRERSDLPRSESPPGHTDVAIRDFYEAPSSRILVTAILDSRQEEQKILRRLRSEAFGECEES